MATNDLKFSDFLSAFDKLGKGEWITAYSSGENVLEGPVFYSALIPEDRVAQSLEQAGWDLHIGDGAPGFVTHYEDGKEITTYYPHSDDGIQPLAIKRRFYGLKDDYWEIAEEFRLYFNLYEDRHNGKLILIDDSGDEEDAVLMSPKEIKIKTRLLKEFAAAKKMRIALFFDVNRFSTQDLTALNIAEYHDLRKGHDYVFSIGARVWDGLTTSHKSHAHLLGKKLIPPAQGFDPSPFKTAQEQFVDFIIGVDDHGKDKQFTCDEDKLGNFFGKNPGASQFVTPVFFSKGVLTKYYSQPAKYSVEDGYLRCGGLWGLRIDNNHSDYVMAFLGDLGHLPHKEQTHWRSFNVSSGTMSYTAFARSFLGQFANPDDPALYFKQRLDSFDKKWERKFGWHFFKPLTADDEYHLRTLHIPLANEQKEFDEQVLTLTKILIDSLNEVELEKSLSFSKLDPKGLDKLEGFLSAKGMNELTWFNSCENCRLSDRQVRRIAKVTIMRE